MPHSESEEAGLDIVLEICFLVTYHVAALVRDLHLECRFRRVGPARTHPQAWRKRSDAAQRSRLIRCGRAV